MFPFHRKHGNNRNTRKQSGGPRYGRRSSEENEMSDEEFLEYIHQNDNSRHQLTSRAHDRYCHKIIRDKEEVLLSALNVKDSSEESADDEFRFGSGSGDVFLEPAARRNCGILFGGSVSTPSSPVESRHLGAPWSTHIGRRKSDTEATGQSDGCSQPDAGSDGCGEYVLTLKIDDLASDVEDISFFRIGPRRPGSPISLQNQCDNGLMDAVTPDAASLDGLDVTRHANVTRYRELTGDTLTKLKWLLVGSAASCTFFNQWFRQCFSFSHIPISRWQLVQAKSGSCGVIAAVEAFIVKCLLFDPGSCKFKEPLRPNQKEIADAFITALSYILWQAGDFQKSVLLIPDNDHDGKINVECNLKEVISESCAYVEYFNYESLKEAVAVNIKYFTRPPYHGYLNFIASAILSRGITRIKEDMDEEVALITENGHCSLELVMLLVTGRAVSNVFDFDIRIDSCLLKGVKKQSDIGFLSLFEYMDTCEVGSFLKSPKFPIWLVNCADHFTLLFSSKLEHASQDILQPFVLYHYDSMTAFSCESDVKLVIDTQTNYTDDQLEKDQSHLQLCIKTKWKHATVIYTENSEFYRLPIFVEYLVQLIPEVAKETVAVIINYKLFTATADDPPARPPHILPVLSENALWYGNRAGEVAKSLIVGNEWSLKYLLHKLLELTQYTFGAVANTAESLRTSSVLNINPTPAETKTE